MTPNIRVFVERGIPEGAGISIASMFVVIEASCVQMCLLVAEASFVPIRMLLGPWGKSSLLKSSYSLLSLQCQKLGGLVTLL